jgi:protein MpaA
MPSRAASTGADQLALRGPEALRSSRGADRRPIERTRAAGLFARTVLMLSILAPSASCVSGRPTARPTQQQPSAVKVALVPDVAAPSGASTLPAKPAVTSSSARADAGRGTAAHQLIRQVVELGRSRQGRRLFAVHIGDPREPPVLVVGCIHGNETAAIAAVSQLAAGPGLPGTNLWLVADANPDGEHAGTRQNAARVDLNRNLPFNWRPSGHPGTLHYTGPAPLSEPESRALAALLRRAHPRLGIWFHQALAVVDVSQGPRRQEDLMSRLLGLPELTMRDYRGSAVGYENQLFPRTAFVVELRAGGLSPSQSRALADSIVKVARSVAG